MATKPGPKLDYALVAQMLVDALLLGDAAAAKRHNVSTRTVERYRVLAASDAALSDLVARKRRLTEGQWSDDLAASLRAGIDFLRRASQEANPKDPEAIKAIAGALKVQAEVAITSRMIDARIAGEDREAPPGAGQVAPEGGGESVH